MNFDLDAIKEALQDLLPEVKTDVSADINEALKANMWKIGAILFVAIILAMIIGSKIQKAL